LHVRSMRCIVWMLIRVPDKGSEPDADCVRLFLLLDDVPFVIRLMRRVTKRDRGRVIWRGSIDAVKLPRSRCRLLWRIDGGMLP